MPPGDDGEADRRLGPEVNLAESDVDAHELDVVNAALYLCKPLLLTGKPGVGKSSLAWRVARELRVGRVLRWSITSRTTLRSGLFAYDAIGRVQAAASLAQSGNGEEPSIGEFVRLGPLGTAVLPSRLPRVVLIDELDKSESDLPNDLLSIFEDGKFVIPELARVRNQTRDVVVQTNDPNGTAAVVDGRVGCQAFPIVVMMSNGEREFPPAFLRRMLQLEIKDPTVEQLAAMVVNHPYDSKGERRDWLAQEFILKNCAKDVLPADRLPGPRVLRLVPGVLAR